MNQLCNSVKLVEGIYCPSDSADVLLSLIADKIKFHNLQKLRLKNEDDPRLLQAETRIQELKEARKSITESILISRDEGYSLKIEATVQIAYLK